MKIIEDTAQQDGKHSIKHQWMQENGIEVVVCPLPVGDYIMANEIVLDVMARKEARGVDVKKMDLLGSFKTSVDTKCNIQELVSDICGKQHPRFRDELILAKNNGIKLFVLVENVDGILSLDSLHEWNNPRLSITKTELVKFEQVVVNDVNQGAVFSVAAISGEMFEVAKLEKSSNGDYKVTLLVGKNKGYSGIIRSDSFDAVKSEAIKFICRILKVKTLKFPTATSGETLKKACKTMQNKYGVEFLFTTPKDSARRIKELLESQCD